ITFVLHSPASFPQGVQAMKRLPLSLVALCVFCGSGFSEQSQSQTSNGNQTNPPTVRATSQEVVLDMVFRDKKGRAIRDVRPEEIHISEDGVEKKMTSFRLIQGGTEPVSEQAAPKLDPMREIRLVTLVFEGLDQEGKRFFRQAVKDLLDMSPEQNL